MTKKMLHPGFEPGLPVPQTGVLTTRLIEQNSYMENPGFDPGASRLQSARSSDWANPPNIDITIINSIITNWVDHICTKFLVKKKKHV